MGYCQVILKSCSTETVCIPFDDAQPTLAGDVKSLLCENYPDSLGAVVLSSLGGKILQDDTALFNTTSTEYLNVSIRLRGGKGGFGSMLRAQGGRMNAQKTTNFEACRDLQGRRIKSVNEAKKLEEELKLIPLREKEKRERLEKKIEKALKEREPKKYLFDDNEFLNNREQMIEEVKDAVSNALKRSHVSSTEPLDASSSSSSSTSSCAVSSISSAPIANKRQKLQNSSSKNIVSVFDDDEDSDEEEESEVEGDEEKEEEEEKEKISVTLKGKGKAPVRTSKGIKV